MYVIQNVYEKNARYIDLADTDFFHYAIEAAKDKYEQDKFDGITYTSDNIDDIKLNQTPVFFASTISKRTDKEIFIERQGIKDRLRRKYLIIDADFDSDEKDESDELFNKAISLANEYKTPLVIYPTASYPDKPRYRIVFFVKRVLSESSYERAMKWLYLKLETVANDNDDYRITGNNNAPIFFNDAQLDKIIDTTQDKNLELLDNKLWKDIKASKKRKVSQSSSSRNDKITIKDEEFEKLISLINIDTYDEFWKFVYSLLRAENNNQITEEQSLHAMKVITHRAPNKETALQWEQDNINFYQNSKSRLGSGSIDLTKTKPLTSYSEYFQAL